jgi:hypothetical protein
MRRHCEDGHRRKLFTLDAAANKAKAKSHSVVREESTYSEIIPIVPSHVSTN